MRRFTYVSKLAHMQIMSKRILLSVHTDYTCAHLHGIYLFPHYIISDNLGHFKI